MSKTKKPIYKRVWFIVLVIIVVIGCVNSFKNYQNSKFDWDEVEFCDRLPKPKSKFGEILSNSNQRISVSVEKTSREDYKNYIEECKSMGYTVDSVSDGDDYEAYDKEGYKLSLNTISKTMYIELEAPVEMGTLEWPKSKIAKLLPLPKSAIGKVSSDTADNCFVYVGDTSKDAYSAYVEQCSEAGFNVDYNKSDDFYNAKDKNGNQLWLEYEGNNIMTVHIEKYDEEDVFDEVEDDDSEETDETEKKQKETKANKKLVDGMHPDFKKAMDEYEEFMDEYCKFMKKYAKSDGSDLEILDDYAKYMSKYADMVESFDAWESEELNTKETKYYIDVQARVNKKLVELTE